VNDVPHKPDDGRRYSEEEFTLILQKASELPDDGSTMPGSKSGMSLEEIQSIAAEAGIDPEKVSRAASLLAGSDQTGRAAAVFGGPSSHHLERAIRGEVSEEDFGRLLDVIRRATVQQGQGGRVLDAFEWKTTGGTSRIHVNVVPRDGETTIQIIADRSGTGILTLLASGVPWLITAVAIGNGLDVTSVAGVASILAGAAGGALLTFRTIWKSTTASFRRKLTGLMEDLSSVVEDAAGLTP
jgi:hypothetical protein